MIYLYSEGVLVTPLSRWDQVEFKQLILLEPIFF